MELPPSVTRVVESHLRFHINRHNNQKERRRDECRIPSLVSLAADTKVRELEEEIDLHAATVRMTEEFHFDELRYVLKNPKATYRLLRAFHYLQVDKGRCAIDLDEAVIRNERFLRDRSSHDGRYLVSLEDFVKMLPNKSFSSPNVVYFIRKDPPKGDKSKDFFSTGRQSLEVLDDFRKRNLEILANSTAFSQTFDRVSQGILRGLDWSNLLLAGDAVLFTLLHTDPAKDETQSIRNFCLNFYIHGLDPEGANRKAEEIYKTWNENLSMSTEQHLVKSTRTLTFRSSWPDRVIQIRLKLNLSPTNVLLGLDLNPIAIAYNGSSVFMLPLCARTIETGYTTFMNDLIFGHHLSNRLSTGPSRLFKYAALGFGSRFLPFFAKFLQTDQCTGKEASLRSDGSCRKESRVAEQRDRYPFGPEEPGLLTLKRVAYLGQDYVRRLHFGPNALTIRPDKNMEYRDEKHWQQSLEEVCDIICQRISEESSKAGLSVFVPQIPRKPNISHFH